MPTVEPFVVGSEARLESYIYDVVDGVSELLDLTGASAVFRATIDAGAPKVWTATIDPDQSGNKGRMYYDLLTTDIDVEGAVQIQGRITLGGKTYVTKIVETFAQGAI